MSCHPLKRSHPDTSRPASSASLTIVSGRPQNEARDAAEGTPPPLSTRDTWRLVWATYRATFPYLLVTILGLILATWLVTTVLFTPGRGS